MKTSLKPIAIFVIVWLIYVGSNVVRYTWTPVLPLVSKDLGITAAQAGGFLTAFFIGYVITQLPGGFLSDRFGYRRVLLSSCLAYSVLTISTAFIHSYWMNFIVMILTGIGGGVIISSAMLAIFDWFPEKRHGLLTGILMTATSLGVTIPNLIVPVVTQDYGWRASKIVISTLTLFVLLLAFFFLKERVPISQRPYEKKDGNILRDISTLVKNRNLLMVGFSGFGGVWATVGTAAWANTYLNKSLHMSLIQAGLIMGLFGIAGLFGKPIIGLVSDFINRKNLYFWSLFLFGPILIWFGINKQVALFYVLAPLLGIFAYAYSPLMNILAAQLVDKHLVGAATGLVNTIFQFGSLFSPLVVGAVIDATHNYLYAFLTLGIGPLIGAIVTVLIKLEDKKVNVTKGSVEINVPS